ncbi:MAG: helix-turn-helix domain-containing protein [Desulfobulbaceae bacterium]|jgi:plasmid maintenance system antidote protein VapI|nr:helix-turn-helix domain-containing protein [Desulfobulbaceae bacterium]
MLFWFIMSLNKPNRLIKANKKITPDIAVQKINQIGYICGMKTRYEEWLSGLKELIYQKKLMSQKDIAVAVGIHAVTVNGILMGRKKAGQAMQDKIAAALGMDYADMLSLGRWILAGQDPEEWQPHKVFVGASPTPSPVPSPGTGEGRRISFPRSGGRPGWGPGEGRDGGRREADLQELRALARRVERRVQAVEKDLAEARHATAALLEKLGLASTK